MATITVEQALLLARQLHDTGQLAAAESFYRRILASQPRHAETLYRLGAMALARGHYEEARAFVADAIAVQDFRHVLFMIRRSLEDAPQCLRLKYVIPRSKVFV